jgi:kynurenine 3-monooxygenase
LQSNEEILSFFEQTFPDTIALMPGLVEEFKKNPVSSLMTVHCNPWIYENHTALIGDAAHAIVPFYGQGMNCGFEDCRVLDELISQYDENWDVILPEYNRLRKPDGDAIANLAKANFIEMRDLVGDENFLLRKKIEAKIYETRPDIWVPLYTMVTFSPDIRYSTAWEKGKIQDDIMKEVMSLNNISTHWNEPEYFKQILEIVEKHTMEHV